MSNRLAKETSPYLQQHAENPVDWYPWGEEAFRHAREENKPIHLSVGYAACHWCHVMAHESFENPHIAELLNEHFINIKVDRQERPDIDDIYQKVVQMMGQGGGWPLTVFLTPLGEPFFGGTYFPPEERYGRPGFPDLLLALSEAWKEKSPELQTQIKEFLKGYRVLDEQFIGGEPPLSRDLPLEAAIFFAKNTDPIYGGLSDAPKFPNPSCHDLVLRVYHRTQEPTLLASVVRTLDHMAAGGIYDHLGGGFARYSVDESWSVPHFEKMLYDNGQLIKLYADAYRVTGKLSWRGIFEETITYVMRDLMHPDGGFYSSESADSEGKEGTFYVWTPEQIKAVLNPSDAAFACRAYGVTEQGNFEQSTVLHLAIDLNAEEKTRLDDLRKQLFLARAQRIRPERDENILTNWNSLMIQGLCAAYQATGEVLYRESAERTAKFLLQKMSQPNGGLYHVWKDGIAKVPGFLDDYSFFANALIDLYETEFDKTYLEQAERLVNHILDQFWDEGFYFTPKDAEQLVHRPRSPQDHAWPSGTSAGVFALVRLHELTGSDIYREHAEYVFKMYGLAAAKYPFGFSHLLAALDFSQHPSSVVFAGDRTRALPLVEAIHRAYHPTRVLAFAEDVPIGEGCQPVEGQPAAYVCKNRSCAPPVTNPEALKD